MHRSVILSEAKNPRCSVGWWILQSSLGESFRMTVSNAAQDSGLDQHNAVQ